jgi:very-short-patch-repair endonuclease
MDAKFRRQHPIEGYIADFVCPEHMLVVELDGGHHNDPQAVVVDEE